MANNTTPVWVDTGTTVLADAALAKGAVRAVVTLDLRAAFGAWLLIAIGRTGATAPASPVVAIVRSAANNAAIRIPGLGPLSRNSNVATPIATTVTGTNAVGTTSLVVGSTTSFVAGDLICISGGTTEYARVAKVTDATHLLLDAPTQISHANAEAVCNAADVFRVWAPGGAVYEVGFDYGAAATGSDVRCQVISQTYTNDTTA